MPAAAATAAQVQARGFEPVVAPLLVVERRWVALPEADAVLVTSGHAVEGVAALRGRPLLAVGDATAALARAAGFACVTSAGGDAAALAALAEKMLPHGARVLLAVGASQGAALATELRRRGLRVQRRVVYAARGVRALPPVAAEALRKGSLEAALFLSAETARVFGAVLPAELRAGLRQVAALAIGEPAAAALRVLPWRRVRVSAEPTLEGVLALL